MSSARLVLYLLGYDRTHYYHNCILSCVYTCEEPKLRSLSGGIGQKLISRAVLHA